MRFHAPRLMLVMIFLYFSEYYICGLNWWWFVSLERALFGDQMVDAHLAFNIIGAVSFGIVASPFLYWPYKYGPQMPPRTRRNCIFFSMSVVFFLHDFPLWCMEFWMVWQYGWITILQGISIVVLTFTTALGTFGVWLGYAWKMSKILQRYFGSSSVSGGNLGGLTAARLGAMPMERI